MLAEALLLAGATALHIGLKSTQQLNVMHHRVWWVPPTSLCLASVEVYVVARVARSGWGLEVVLPVALGGATGCILAMEWHRRARKRKENSK